MSNRITAYIYILLANIILLAFAVIPHHHHDVKVCFTSYHCQNNAKESKHNESHQHDGPNSDNNNCKFIHAVSISTSYQSKNNIEVNSPDLSFLSLALFDISVHNYLAEISNRTITLLNPLSATVFSSYINASLGLRGPPQA